MLFVLKPANWQDGKYKIFLFDIEKMEWTPAEWPEK